MFPINGSLRWYTAFLQWLPEGLVRHLHRYYQCTKTSYMPSCRTSFPSFDNTIYALYASYLCHALSHLESISCVPGYTRRGFIPVPLKRFSGMERVRPPGFPGNPLLHLPCSRTPAESSISGIYSMVDAVPVPQKIRDFHDHQYFGALSHGFCSRCVRFTHQIALTHATLASGCVPDFTGWDLHPPGYSLKFQRIYILFPINRAFPGAIRVSVVANYHF